MIDQQSQAATRTLKESAAVTKQTLASYDDARRAIMKELDKLFRVTLADIPEADRYNYMLQRNRLTTLLKKIDAEYVKYSVRAGAQTREAIDISASNMYYRDQYVLDWFSPVGGVGIDYTPLPRPLANVIVSGNMEQWNALSKSVRRRIEETFGTIDQYVPEAGTLSDLLSKNRRQEIAQINQAITSGLLRGQGARSIAKEISKVIGTVTGDMSTGAKAKALRIARTESVRALNAGAYANSQAVRSQGVNNQKIWIATLDLRTRDSHGNLDGTIKDLEENFIGSNGSGLRPGAMNAASENINCRCRLGDVIDGVPPTIRRGVNPETNESELFEWKTFNDWKKTNGLRTTPTGKITPKPKPRAKPKAAPKPKTSPASTTQKGAQNRAVRDIPSLEEAKYTGMTPAAADAVTDTVVKYNEKWGDLGITHIKTVNQKRGPVAAAVAHEDGRRVLELNRAKLGVDGEISLDPTLGMKRMLRENWVVTGNLQEVVTHELGHFATYRGKTFSKLLSQDRILGSSTTGANWGAGISRYARTSGNEAIAEALVKLEKGGSVNDAVLEAIRTYTGIDV